eukprot:UN15784
MILMNDFEWMLSVKNTFQRGHCACLLRTMLIQFNEPLCCRYSATSLKIVLRAIKRGRS